MNEFQPSSDRERNAAAEPSAYVGPNDGPSNDLSDGRDAAGHVDQLPWLQAAFFSGVFQDLEERLAELSHRIVVAVESGRLDAGRRQALLEWLADSRGFLVELADAVETRIGRKAAGRIQIRTASKSDAEAIAEVEIAAKREAYCDFLPADGLARIVPDARTRAAAYRYLLAEGYSPILVAEVDGHIAGYVDFDAWEEEETPETGGEIMALFVRPEEWGLGIGQALMREAMARLRDRGWVEVVLWVYQRNRRAVDFCERLGFRMDGTVCNLEMYGDRAARVRLRRLLEGSE
jgi:GNAT superfamily N-acetyltransferase